MIYVCKEALFKVEVVWRCAMTMCGALYVMIGGAQPMLGLSVNNWDIQDLVINAVCMHSFTSLITNCIT